MGFISSFDRQAGLCLSGLYCLECLSLVEWWPFIFPWVRLTSIGSSFYFYFADLVIIWVHNVVSWSQHLNLLASLCLTSPDNWVEVWTDTQDILFVEGFQASAQVPLNNAAQPCLVYGLETAQSWAIYTAPQGSPQPQQSLKVIQGWVTFKPSWVTCMY